MLDTVIKNCKIVSPRGLIEAGIAISHGKIVAIAKDEALPEANNVIDAGGKFLIPGLVDPHAHINVVPRDVALGIDNAKKIRTETQGCPLGGITTIINMMVIGDTSDLLTPTKHFVDIYEKFSYVDLGITSVIIAIDQTRQIRELAEYGIAGFKLNPCLHLDDSLIYKTFIEIANLVKQGYRVHAKVHCENTEIASRLKEEYMARSIKPLSWHEVRPSFLEVEAMNRVIYLGNETVCPLYIVHVSSKEGTEIVAKARVDGLQVVAETCPYYLVLNTENSDSFLSPITPPVRTKEDNEKLWKGIRDGIIGTIATDHVGVLKMHKEGFWTAIGGLPGFETLLPIMLSEGVNKKRISLEKLVEVCCFNPAKISGLLPRKGIIEVGSDADLVIIDLDKEDEVPEKSLYTMSDFSPYAGWRLKGWPVLTMIRGTVVMEHGKVVGKLGFGKYIPAKIK